VAAVSSGPWISPPLYQLKKRFRFVSFKVGRGVYSKMLSAHSDSVYVPTNAIDEASVNKRESMECLWIVANDCPGSVISSLFQKPFP
jgi:hypothetical protein